jgi:hypothetical protein
MLKFAQAILLFAVLALPPVSLAGDDVNYSAPYLVVENGELVTKYPATEHEGAVQNTDEQAAATAAPAEQKITIDNTWLIPIPIVVIIALLIMISRRRQRREKTR